MAVITLLNAINKAIINPLILLVFAVSLLMLFWGIFQFIASQTADAQREEGKRKIFWGLFGMFIMISAYGLIRVILGTFGITGPEYLNL